MKRHQNLRQYALLLQIIIITRLGLAFLRVFAVSAMWGLERFALVNFRYLPAGIITLTFLTFLSSWLLLKRIYSLHITRWWTYITFGLGLFRIVEQLNHNAIGDYLLSGSGVILFIVYFSVVYQTARTRKGIDGNLVATGIAIGIMVDTALRGALWTLDLSWQPGLWPISIVTILAVTCVGLSLIIKPQNGQTATTPKAPLSWGILILGPYFFLVQHLFGDISRILQGTGWTLATSLAFLLTGNLLGVLATHWTPKFYQKKSLRLLPWLFFLGIASTTMLLSTWQYIVALYFVEIISSVLVTTILEILFSSPGDKNILRSRKTYLIGFFIYLLFVMVFYSTGTNDLVFVFVGIMVALVFWKTTSEATLLLILAPRREKVWGGLFIILLLPLIFVPWLVANDQFVPDATISAEDTISVMQLNIHQGVDAYGRLSLWEQAKFIRESDVDIVALNEVSRGSLWSGSADTLLWLSHELDMYAAYGPTIGHVNGNAFLSKFPLENVDSQIYSTGDSVFPSGCTTATISLGQKTLKLVSTHVVWSKIDTTRKNLLDRTTGNHPERINLFHALVSSCLNGSESSLLLGDMNVKPDSEAIKVLREIGLRDSAEISPERDTFTWHTTLPLRRIDYVFGSSEVFFESYQVVPVVLSDHFPIIVSLSLQDTLASGE